jgi:murein DD-endopeptidase MepM/ murein hydrolase activator NlpD
MKEGNRSEAKKFAYGFRFRGNLVEVKHGFKQDLADYIIHYVKSPNMFWLPVTNKGIVTIYGHLNQSEYREFLRIKDHANAGRLYNKANALIAKHLNAVEPDELPC